MSRKQDILDFNLIWKLIIVNFSGEKFAGSDLTAVFGAVKSDLKNAIIEQDTVVYYLC